MSQVEQQPSTDEHYTIISADCHAGGSHEMYREYLDPAWRGEFDAWREKYKNPFRDLQDGGRIRNWDDERRNGDLEADGIVAEVVFPNTVPPFFPSFILFARPPTEEQYPARLAGIRAHNRWLADWCARFPNRRAGIGQIFLNDVDDAIADVALVQRARAARRRAAVGRPAGLQVRQAALRPLLRPPVGGVRGAGHAGEQPRWHGDARLRALPRGRPAVHHRGALLLAAPVRAAALRRGVRTLPPDSSSS